MRKREAERERERERFFQSIYKKVWCMGSYVKDTSRLSECSYDYLLGNSVSLAYQSMFLFAFCRPW